MKRRFTAADADALFSARWLKGARPTRGGRSREPEPVKPRPAAGVLLRHSAFDGDWYLLGLRAERLGGTWSNIGGSLNRDEHPLVGALRELHEEIAIPVRHLIGARMAQVVECGTERVPYTLFVLDVPRTFDDAELGWENDDLAWFHASAIEDLNLHSGFRRAWAQVGLQRVSELLP